VIGGVEVHPGPLSIQEEAEILEFVKKTEESEVEVKRFMEAIEKNLSGISLEVTRQTEAIEEGNKTMKGLETGMNRMKTEMDKIKIRQNKCEWKREAWEEEVKRK
jgi:soluble cytochrome b562